MSPSLAQAFMLRKSDQALCAAVRDGHEAAFAAIVLRYRSQLLRHCRSVLRDAHAEDAVQLTFIRALQALRAGTEVRELGPWLHRIARNVALTELSTPGRDYAELNEEWADSAHADELDRRADLHEALVAVEALPHRQRTALLRSVAGDKPAVIAEQLGLSNVALRQLLHRARVTVRAAVNAICPPPLVWLARRVIVACEKVPQAAGVPAGAAPVVSKVAVVVVASVTVAAPATVIHSVLTQHRRPNRAPRQIASRHAPAAPVAQSRIVFTASQSSQTPAPSAPAGDRVHRHVSSRRPAPVRQPDPRPSDPPRAIGRSAPQVSTQSSHAAGVSAASPNSAPVGSSTSSDSAGNGAPIAAAASASDVPGSASSGAGPVSTATASGPAASGSGTGP